MGLSRFLKLVRDLVVDIRDIHVAFASCCLSVRLQLAGLGNAQRWAGVSCGEIIIHTIELMIKRIELAVGL